MPKYARTKAEKAAWTRSYKLHKEVTKYFMDRLRYTSDDVELALRAVKKKYGIKGRRMVESEIAIAIEEAD